MTNKATDADFLAAYDAEETWAPAHGITQKTCANYRNQVDGLPFLVWGKKIYIPRKEGAAWIRARVTQKNPSQPRSRRARRAEIEATT